MTARERLIDKQMRKKRPRGGFEILRNPRVRSYNNRPLGLGAYGYSKGRGRAD